MFRFVSQGLALLCLGCALQAQAQVTDRYINERHHYSVTMPQGWVRVPEEVAQKHFERVVEDAAKADALQDYVFQSGDKAWFSYPYAVVQVIPYVDAGMTSVPDAPAMRQFVADIFHVNTDAVLQGRIDRQAMFTGGSLSEPVFDPQSRTFAYTLRINRANQRDIVGAARGWFGRDVIVQITFYDQADDWEASADPREFLFASFGFEPKTAYPDVPGPVAEEAVPQQNVWEGYLGWGLVFGLCLLAIVVGLAWTKLRQK